MGSSSPNLGFSGRGQNWAVLGLTMYLIINFIGFWNPEFLFYSIFAGVLLFLSFWKIGKGLEIKFYVMDLCITIWFFYEITSFFVSNYPFNSFSFLLKVSILFMLYFSWVIIGRRIRVEQFMLVALVFYGGLIALGAMLQFVVFHFELGRLGFAKMSSFKGSLGPYGVPINDWATIMFLLFVLNVYLIATFYKSRYLLYPLMFNCCFLFVNMVLSFSRGIYVSLIFFIAPLCYACLRFNRSYPRRVYAASVLSIGIVVFALLPVRNSVFTTLGMVETTSQVRSAKGRLGLWGRSWELVRQAPVVGIGSNNFSLRYLGNSEMYKTEDTTVLKRVNNTPLQILIDKGVLGFLIYFLLGSVFLTACCSVLIKRSARKKEKLLVTILILGMGALVVKELTFTSLLTNWNVLFLMTIWLALVRKRSRFLHRFSLKGAKFLLLLIPILSYYGWLSHKNYVFNIAESNNKKCIEHLSIGEFSKSQIHIEAAIKYVPSHAAYHLNKGILHMTYLGPPFTIHDILKRKVNFTTESKGLKDLKESFLQVLRINPKDALAHYCIGWLSFYKGELSSAKYYFGRACEKGPNEPMYNLSQALLYYHLNENGKAVLYLKRAIMFSPRVLHSDLWKILMSKPEFIESEVIKDIVLEMKQSYRDSHNPILAARLAWVMAYNGATEDARDLFERVTIEMPNLNRPWLGLAEMTDGDNNLRENLFKRSEFLDKNDYLPKLGLAILYEDMGYNELALSYYRKALVQMSEMGLGLLREKASASYRSLIPAQTFCPIELLHLSIPNADPKYHCLQLAGLYQKVGNKKLAKAFMELANQTKLTFPEIVKHIKEKDAIFI